MPVRVLLVVALLASHGSAFATPAVPAVDRGRLSLAWDAHESGLLEEALAYLADVAPNSPVAPDATWLRADCLYRLGRYEEAVRVLESAPARALEDREAFLHDVYWDWAWSATHREAYGEAEKVLALAQRALPTQRALAALAEATRFRAEVARELAGGAGRTGGGDDVAVRLRGVPPAGSGWVRAYPWTPDVPWIPEATLDDWMPAAASRLRADGRALWLRLPPAAFRRQLETAARDQGLTAKSGADGLVFAAAEETLSVDEAEWLYRAAAEGLGPRGAAVFAAVDARDELEGRAALTTWVRAHRGALDVARDGALLVLRNRETGRSLELDPAAWIDVFDPDGEEWTGFWSEVTTELSRPTRPFRCFCGREVMLREVLAREADGAFVFERGSGYQLLLAALCPLHQQFVTEALLKEWGVSAAEAWDRARHDAVARPWELAFQRGEAQGSRYLVLEGEGVAALARTPTLLLGALEAVDGAAVRGTSVRVIAPSASTLVVTPDGTPEPAAEEATAQTLLAAARRGGRVERVGYRATVRLPAAAAGTFRVSSGE